MLNLAMGGPSFIVENSEYAVNCPIAAGTALVFEFYQKTEVVIMKDVPLFVGGVMVGKIDIPVIKYSLVCDIRFATPTDHSGGSGS